VLEVLGVIEYDGVVVAVFVTDIDLLPVALDVAVFERIGDRVFV